MRRLADLGWEVAYLGIPEFRESIAAAGGKLFDVNELGKEFGIAAGLSYCTVLLALPGVPSC